MTSPRVARQPYTKRPTPNAYDRTFLDLEFSNIQRAIPAVVVQTVTADYMPLVGDTTVFVDATAGAVSVFLPTASRTKGMTFTIKKIDASVHAVTIAGTLDGAVNPTLATQYKAKTVQSDGTAWFTLATV